MATVKRDYYEVLGVGRDASDDDIRRAFRRLARQHHPDVNADPDAERAFKEANEAYEVLSDPERRRRYDLFGHAGAEGRSTVFSGGFGPFADLFETFFGAGIRTERRGPARGADLRLDLEVDFLEAVFGAERKVEVPREESCSRCEGGGGEPGTGSTACPGCGGTGEVRTVHNSLFGRMVNVRPCPRCEGEGRILERPCTRCGGSGRERTRRELTVTIPAGVDDGQRLRLTGEGEGGERGGPPGDLYVVLHVRPHPVFERRGHDLLYELRISPVLAALGGEVEVPSVDGPQKLTIPAGTQEGALLRLRGRGVPRLGGSGRGEQLVVTRVVVPTKLSAKERRLWNELRAVSAEPERSDDEKGLLERLKDALRG